ncbi:MAG: hypothetical protein DMG59_10120 [Acidobacteria bacterium]|jgi:hypothetical protein|nr:MAG: hypothetical protein DMG59_10120 [Acidobacteriota bacterium]
MPTMEEVKNRRDAALQNWRRELLLLNNLPPNSPQWKKQQNVVQAARAHYDKASAEYLDLLAGTESPKQEDS